MAYKYTWICSFFTYQLLMKPSLDSFCTTPLLIYGYKYSKKLNISSSKLYSGSFIYIALIFCARSYWQWKTTFRVTWWVRTIHSSASIDKWTNGCMFLLISELTTLVTKFVLISKHGMMVLSSYTGFVILFDWVWEKSLYILKTNRVHIVWLIRLSG